MLTSLVATTLLWALSPCAAGRPVAETPEASHAVQEDAGPRLVVLILVDQLVPEQLDADRNPDGRGRRGCRESPGKRDGGETGSIREDTVPLELGVSDPCDQTTLVWIQDGIQSVIRHELEKIDHQFFFGQKVCIVRGLARGPREARL